MNAREIVPTVRQLSRLPGDRADVVIVGGRVAGAATAMLLAMQGHDVIVVDRADVPGDTLSTHGISRSGVVQLNRWGLLQRVLDSGAPAVREVVFHVDGTSVARTIKAHAGVDLLVAPRRQVLDGILLDAAREAGARVRTGLTIDGVRRADGGRAVGVFGRDGSRHVEIDARFVVGADGLRSRVARSVGAPLTDARLSAGATHYAYFAGDWGAMEYFRTESMFAGIFPTHGGEACVWACMPTDDAEQLRRRSSSVEAAFRAMIESGPSELADRLVGAVRTSPVRGMVRLPNHVRQAVGPGWALVGDAGYHRDAITGHGISDAFRDAELLAEALDMALRGECDEITALRSYHARRDEMLREIFEITCELSQFPPAHRFTELQKQLGRAIEHEADVLAARPAPASFAVA